MNARIWFTERQWRIHQDTLIAASVGEINTMPGFTARSVFARGWAQSGGQDHVVLVKAFSMVGLSDVAAALKEGTLYS